MLVPVSLCRMGLTKYAKNRADQIAQLGYAGFACDMFGGGCVATDITQVNSLPHRRLSHALII